MRWIILGGIAGLIMIVVSVITISPDDNNPSTNDVLSETISQQETIRSIDPTIKTNSKIRIISYNVEPIPDVSNRQIIQNALDNALISWEEENNLVFQQTSIFPDMQIEWQTIASENHAGLATYSEKYKGVITIGLGKFNCNSEYVQYDGNLLHQTIMHEIGHILGLGHHPEEIHLMYGVDDIDLKSIENFEYVIPKHYDGFFEGYIQLETNYNILNSKLEDLNEKIEELEKQYTVMNTEYEIILSKLETNSQYLNQVNSIEQELTQLNNQINSVINNHNEIVYNMNEIVDQMSCFPDIIK
ncbi:MAG: matrixin family metalloprotease [Nitrosopumilus sp.]|nr:matrixin family metalloprotease [Nitrosopumilus sp.]MDH3823705.1 matrixin family metalloprotease [Nitrosopumilus sp.]MDH3856103.1 matrixin family metalloprotease [Nitrosopumilus sp.]